MPSPPPLPPEVVAVLGQATPREARTAETSLPPAAIQALQNGNKIEAIRLVREHSGLGLAEAKYPAGRGRLSHLPFLCGVVMSRNKEVL